MHGLFTPSAAFFRNTTTLKKIAPSRAKTRMGTVPDSRTLNPFVSFEERKVVKVSIIDAQFEKRAVRAIFVTPFSVGSIPLRSADNIVPTSNEEPSTSFLPGIFLHCRLL